MNKVVFFIGASVFFSVSAYAGCAKFSCDGTISYAIGRYSERTVKRLDDYKKTIRVSKESDELYGKVLDEQNRELAKMIARSMIEAIYIKQIVLLSSREKDLH